MNRRRVLGLVVTGVAVAGGVSAILAQRVRCTKPPKTLPNVLRNVIAHELGHAIGLDHDQDPTLLMCGRPAPCRPDIYQSEVAVFFPLSAAEKSRLLVLYPAG